MTLEPDKFVGEVIKWLRKITAIMLLLAIAMTALDLIVPGIQGLKAIPLTQDVGIGLAGIAALLWKI